MISYKVQFDKLTEAYINNRVRPYYPCACFIGNLLGEETQWVSIRHYGTFGTSTLVSESEPLGFMLQNSVQSVLTASQGMYSPKDIVNLENNFLYVLELNTVGEPLDRTLSSKVISHENYEEALFLAFSSTLDLLKEIHEAKGEVVDEFIFIKRDKKKKEVT